LGNGIVAERAGGLKSCRHKYDDVISAENLLISWQEFLRGKRQRKDVIEFSLRLTDNIISLHLDPFLWCDKISLWLVNLLKNEKTI
jgi:hypothetical protein